MLVNIRGTNGSGKTYVSHKLILDHKHEELIEPKVVLGKNFVKANAYAIEGGLFSVGRWKSGLDGIFPQEIVEEILRYWAPRGNIVWENVLVSANIGRWAVLAKELEPINHNVWVYMDTPLETCIERVFSRREASAEAGFNHRQENSDVKLDVIAGHWRRVRRSAARAYQEGIDVRWVDHRMAYEQIHDMLVVEGGWRPEGDIQKVFMPAFPLVPWKPSEEELQLVLKTARLPWEPEDTVTKVDYVSKPRFKDGASQNEVFGCKIRRWGGDKPEELVGFGVTVYPWVVAEDNTITLSSQES